MKKIQSCDPRRQELLKLALRAARAGRAELLSRYGRLKNIERKFQAGLVTEADKASERAIFQILRNETPEFDFLGEESTTGKIEKSKSEYRWIVDPLDGTTNYVHQFPFWGVSIGLEHNGQIIVGVVDAPALGEVFCAIRGGGSYLNGQQLHITKNKSLTDAFVATGFHGEIPEVLEEQVRMFSHLARKVRAVRRAGSAALDLCYTARGVFDFYYEKNLQPWDAAAGMLVVEEAGGINTSFRGKPASPYWNSLVSGVPELVKEFTKESEPYFSPGTD